MELSQSVITIRQRRHNDYDLLKLLLLQLCLIKMYIWFVT